MRRLLLLLLTLALVPTSAVADHDGGQSVRCGGLAPIDAGCLESFVLTKTEVGIGVSMGHGFPFAGSVVVVAATESDAVHKKCIAAFVGVATCHTSFGLGRFEPGQTLTISVAVPGAGAWAVEVRERDPITAPGD